ncbi:MAG: tetratricopeptide repeat protein [bacterium]
MTDPIRTATAPPPTASVPEFIATFVVILVSIGVLLVVDGWLARIDRNESRGHAASLFADGRSLLATHRAHEASERFASAVAIDRTNTAYELGLAEAMLADGRAAEAETTLESVLDRAQTDGAANLMMARVLVTLGRTGEAKSFFHRAIYGGWSDDSLGQRAHSRFELIALLARQGARQELLAELLTIQDVPPDSLELRRRLGHLFIEAGSPAHGAELLRTVLQRFPDDADAYAGMGDAALAMGKLRTARADLAAAVRLRPDDTTLVQQLSVADTALALDPLQRGIGVRSREQRSRAVLALTLQAHDRCAPPGAVRSTLTDSARKYLATDARTRVERDDSDAALVLATDLWESRGTGCGTKRSVTDKALALIMAKLPT